MLARAAKDSPNSTRKADTVSGVVFKPMEEVSARLWRVQSA